MAIDRQLLRQKIWVSAKFLEIFQSHKVAAFCTFNLQSTLQYQDSKEKAKDLVKNSYSLAFANPFFFLKAKDEPKIDDPLAFQSEK